MILDSQAKSRLSHRRWIETKSPLLAGVVNLASDRYPRLRDRQHRLLLSMSIRQLDGLALARRQRNRFAVLVRAQHLRLRL
ncbi:MAG: hypothetical protein V2A73_13390, partial [Pseudomonadota bacterium]